MFLSEVNRTWFFLRQYILFSVLTSCFISKLGRLEIMERKVNRRIKGILMAPLAALKRTIIATVRLPLNQYFPPSLAFFSVWTES